MGTLAGKRNLILIKVGLFFDCLPLRLTYDQTLSNICPARGATRVGWGCFMEMWLDHTGVDGRGIHRKRPRADAGDGSLAIDLTPMLDVVMIMLIFFIVAGSFIRESSIEVERKPTSTANSDQPSENITVQISANNDIWIKNRRIDARAVRANLSRLRAENPKAAVVIKAHNKSTVDILAAVIDSSREAGIYNVSLSNGE